MKLLPASSNFRITKPVCPTCGATLRVKIIALREAADGAHTVAEIDITCESIGPSDLEERDRWMAQHNADTHRMHTIAGAVTTWLNHNYRFKPTPPPCPSTTSPSAPTTGSDSSPVSC